MAAAQPPTARAIFAAFARRALNSARARGMTDRDIEKATGVGSSTFHRWTKVAGGMPEVERVYSFCDGLGIPHSAGAAALGLTDTREATPPEEMPEDLLTIARRLQDPNVPESEKFILRETIRALVQRRPPKSDRKTG